MNRFPSGRRNRVGLLRSSWLLIAVLLVPSVVRSDALVVTMAMNATTIAEFFVAEDGVTVDLEISVADMMAFADLVPDEIYASLMRAAQGPDAELVPLEQRLPRFFQSDLRIIADGGRPLAGEVLEMQARRRMPRDQVSGDPLPVGPDYEGEPVVAAKLFYSFTERPERVSFHAPTDQNGAVNANIGFVAYHNGLHVNDFRYLSADQTLTLDWADAWYSTFGIRSLRRQFYAPINGFLYMEPFEVRKEVVVRPRDLQHWVDLGIAADQTVLTVAEQETIKQRAAEFLAARLPVRIDGKSATGELDRVHFIFRNLRTSGVIDPPQDLPVVSATLGVIFVYPTDGLPDEVTMEWDLFTDRIDSVPTSATDEAGGLPYIVAPDDPVLRWTNFLTNPTVPGLATVASPPPAWTRWVGIMGVIALTALIGLGVAKGKDLARGDAGAVVVIGMVVLLLFAAVGFYSTFVGTRFSQANVEVVLDDLLENVYRAFDYRGEENIYDSLENTVSGDLLTAIYLETRRSLELENQGGARAKVKGVEILDATYEPLPRGGFSTEARWNVTGSVGHWGHTHQRINQYRAAISVEQIDGAWRITGLDVLEEERIDPNAPPVVGGRP